MTATLPVVADELAATAPPPAAAGPTPAAVPGDGTPPGARGESAFTLHLSNFEGPFDLLLGLIAKHRLDVTEVALSAVTDEFIAYLRAAGPDVDLDQTSDFLVVAATLLDLKAARLLPQGEVEDEEDLARLEARDLLFARLLQYRAFKLIGAELARTMAAEGRRYPRAVGLEERFASLLPEVLLGLSPAEFGALAATALQPRPAPVLSLAHLHAARVSVRAEAVLVVERLRRLGAATFRVLTADAPDLLTTVARFLALLELFREGSVGFDQVEPLGELTVRWSGAAEGDVEVGGEFDDADPGAREPAPAPEAAKPREDVDDRGTD